MNRYQPNNILFRIASSNAISKFKALQASSFVQLARKDLAFDESAREVVLLEFDNFSQWIFRLERLCLLMKDGLVTQERASALSETGIDEFRTISMTIDSHPDIFDPTIASFVRVIHGYSLSMLLQIVGRSIGLSSDRAFEMYVQTISDYLQHLLMSLHEFNSNYIMGNNNPFVSVSDFCLQGNSKEERYYPLRKRVDFFRNEGCGSTYILKNYSGEDIIDEASEQLAKYNINLLSEDLVEQRAIA